MTQHNDPRPLSAYEIRTRLARQVAQYRTNPNPLEHERLLPLIHEHFGENSADFFDEEGCLPLSNRTGPGKHPWPIHAEHASGIPTAPLAAIFIAGITTAALHYALPLPTAAGIGLLIGLTIHFIATPLIAKKFPPTDLAERLRLVNAYTAIAERNEATAQRLHDEETTQAETERTNRRLRRLTDDPNI